MTPERFLDDLVRRGVHLEARGGLLHVRAPKGVLTPELRRLLASHKPALMSLVQVGAPRAGAPGDAPAVPTTEAEAVALLQAAFGAVVVVEEP